MKKTFLFLALSLIGCSSSEIEKPKEIIKAPTCFEIIETCSCNEIKVVVYGTVRKYIVEDIRNYRLGGKVCDLSGLKQIPL